jgi:spermidine synthase
MANIEIDGKIYVPIEEVYSPPKNTFTEEYMYESKSMKYKNILLDKDTDFQNMKVLDTYEYGKVILLNNKIHNTAYDSNIQYEMQVIPAILSHPNPKQVLIFGAAGNILQEVLKFHNIEEIFVIESDESLLSLCREWVSDYKNTKVNVICNDAEAYLKNCPKNTFDLIFMDFGLSYMDKQNFFTDSFLYQIKRVMRDDSIYITPMFTMSWGSTYVAHRSELLYSTFGKNKVMMSITNLPSRITGSVFMGFCTKGNVDMSEFKNKNIEPTNEFLKQRGCKYFTFEMLNNNRLIPEKFKNYFNNQK